MAFIDTGVWALALTVRDNNGKTASCSVNLPGTLVEAEVQTFGTNLAAAVQAAIDGDVIGFNLSRQYNSDAAPAALPSSEVERKLIIPLGTAARPNVTRIEIPSPSFALELNGTDAVDVADPLYTAIVNVLTAGALGPGNGAVTHYGADITRAGQGFVSHRNRRPNK